MSPGPREESQASAATAASGLEGRWGRVAGLPRTVVLLGFTALFNDVATEMIFPLLPLFLADTLHASPAFLGAIEGVADSAASLLKLASGILADRQARRPLVVLGFGLAAAARPLVAAATHPWQVFAVRVCDRVGKGIRGSPRDALIADAAGARAGRAFGFHQAMDNLGAVVGPLVAALLLLGLSIRSVFWVAALPGLVATALAASVPEPRRPTAVEPRLPIAVDPRRPTAAEPHKPTEAAHEPMGATANARHSPWLSSYFAILTVFSLGNSSDAFLLLRARALGVPAFEIPVLWATLNLSKVVWAFVGGNLADRVSRPRLIAAGWLVFAGVYAGLGSATRPWHAWLLFAVYGVFYGLTEPVEKALVKELAPPHRRGQAYGVFNFLSGAATLPASLVAGAVWSSAGPGTALALGAALAGFAAMALLGWDALRARQLAAHSPVS